MPQKRVLIIGLDGFTWDLGRKLTDEGVMPALTKLIESGTHGNLESTLPCETSPGWASLQTGCHPDKTSVYAFHSYDRHNRKVHLNSFKDIAVPTLWTLASDAGKTVVSINMPISSPPPKVNGVMIPGFLCPELSPETVHPPEAYEKYIKPAGNYKIVDTDHTGPVEQFTNRSIATETARRNVALKIMQDTTWDIFSIQMQTTDPVQHVLWNVLMDDNHPDRETALRFYRACDGIIADLIEAAGDDVLKIIASDHGFCELKHPVNINVWLRQHGYLHLIEKDKTETAWTKAKKKIPPLKVMAQVAGKIQQSLKETNNDKLVCETVLTHLRNLIDFEKTQAFCLGGMAGLLYINGTPQQRTELAEKLTAQILADLGPDSQNPALERIVPGETAYNRSDAGGTLPDLFLEFAPGISGRLEPASDSVIVQNAQAAGTHSKQGVFLANGPDVKSAVNLDCSIVDIVPTILAYMGIPVPKHIDGKVLTEAFDKLPEIQYTDSDFSPKETTNYDDNEQSIVEKQLTDLGYL